MRKSWVRLMLAAAGAVLMAGEASAQSSVQFWLNSLGDSATNMPSVIDVQAGSTATLSVYLQTSNIGPLEGLNAMFGYSSTTTGGLGAVAADSNATFSSFAWASSDLSSNQLFAGAGGGGGPANGTSRPYGYFLSSANIGGTLAGTGDGAPFHIFDITLNINAAAGTDIPVSIWSFGTTDYFASAVLNANGDEFYPSSPYSATLHVVPVPEPATFAILGIGALAVLRRRRSK